jgi:hypothetical protein
LFWDAPRRSLLYRQASPIHLPLPLQRAFISTPNKKNATDVVLSRWISEAEHLRFDGRKEATTKAFRQNKQSSQPGRARLLRSLGPSASCFLFPAQSTFAGHKKLFAPPRLPVFSDKSSRYPLCLIAIRWWRYCACSSAEPDPPEITGQARPFARPPSRRTRREDDLVPSPFERRSILLPLCAGSRQSAAKVLGKKGPTSFAPCNDEPASQAPHTHTGRPRRSFDDPHSVWFLSVAHPPSPQVSVLSTHTPPPQSTTQQQHPHPESRPPQLPALHYYAASFGNLTHAGPRHLGFRNENERPASSSALLAAHLHHRFSNCSQGPHQQLAALHLDHP